MFIKVAVPTAVAFLIRASENTLLVAARREWYQQPWSRDLAREEISAWHAAAAGQADVVGVRAGVDGAGRAVLAAGAATTAVFGLVTLVLAIPLVVASSIGPVLASIAAPTFSSTMRRAATAGALESLRLPENDALTPREAGEALHSLSPSNQDELFRPPPRSYDPIPIDDARESNPTGVDPYRWAEDLVPLLGDGRSGTGALGPDAVAYLEGLGRLPALQEWHVLGTSAGLDELGARYVFPLPDTLSMWSFPIPRMSDLREAAYAQVGAAVGAAASGRTGEAETRLRELIGAGLLLGRDGETLISNLIGFVIADTGGAALANLYEATGRAEDAAAVRNLMEAGERAAAMSRTGVGATDMDEMPPVVTDSLTIRGLRWEYFSALSTLGPCLNLNRVVFGPPPNYDEWLQEVHTALVRTDEEDDLFELARHGWGVRHPKGLQPVLRLFAQVMGGGVESCAALAAATS